MSYATAAQLLSFSGIAVSGESDRMLERASELIDDFLRSAIYEVDAYGLPTDTDVAAAMRDACCAQVEFWLAGHEEDDMLGPITDASLGGLSFTQERIVLAPRAARILRNAGLYQTDPVTL